MISCTKAAMIRTAKVQIIDAFYVFHRKAFASKDATWSRSLSNREEGAELIEIRERCYHTSIAALRIMNVEDVCLRRNAIRSTQYYYGYGACESIISSWNLTCN